jgi:hypothetical protein
VQARRLDTKKGENKMTTPTPETALVPPHKRVRESILAMQKHSGSAIKPFGLFNVFYKILQRDSRHKMNRVKARNVADVFSALQNEFFVINHDGKNVEWFYMTEKRWAKYGLGRKAIYNSLMFLRLYSIIETQIRPHPLKRQNKVRFYRFDLEMLFNLQMGIVQAVSRRSRT